MDQSASMIFHGDAKILACLGCYSVVHACNPSNKFPRISLTLIAIFITKSSLNSAEPSSSHIIS